MRRVVLGALVVGFLSGLARPTWAAGPGPCDGSVSPPQCTSALGPLRDVSNSWASYQPALLQPIPIADYYPGDPEDMPPPIGAGFCGTEKAPTTGPAVPASSIADHPPVDLPAPRGGWKAGQYCLLRYLPTDFTALCRGCSRVLIDYAAVGSGNAVSPGADGHWAARFSSGMDFGVTAPVNGHSPNIKNLCADKSFNPAAGSDCGSPVSDFDLHSLSWEGDNTIYHHYPLEGRYYNGPAYLAGDGGAHPYHWVQGAYFDLYLGGASSELVWYSAGYRGHGDPAPDTDQSYACACELPGLGHQGFSPSVEVKGTAPVSGAQPGTTTPPALPNTGGGVPVTATEFGVIPLALLRLRRRRA